MNVYRIDPKHTRFSTILIDEVVRNAAFTNFELMFSGGSEQSLHLLYREYTADDLIRPAFTQELSYPRDSEILMFRKLRIKIERSTPGSLDFVVLEDGR